MPQSANSMISAPGAFPNCDCPDCNLARERYIRYINGDMLRVQQIPPSVAGDFVIPNYFIVNEDTTMPAITSPRLLPDVQTCAVCGEDHAPADMVAVRDENNESAYAREYCIVARDNRGYNPWIIADNVISNGRYERNYRYFHNDATRLSLDSEDRASQIYAEGHWYYSEEADGYYADYSNSPEGEAENQDRDTFDYSTNVINVHGWPSETAPDSLCFGVELEMEAREDRSEVTSALGGANGDGTYILKEDGSLDNGVEMVTLPYTLAHHQDKFNWKGKLSLVQRLAMSGRGTSNCGIHVHINRKAISPLTLGKMLVFMNSPINNRMIKLIAQRDPEAWARFTAKKITDGKKLSPHRYEAINVTRQTAEVRIFRGNLRPERVLKNLEFCHALVSFCKIASMTALNWGAFAKFISCREMRGQYQNLIKFIAEVGATDDVDSVNDSKEV